MYSVCDGQPKGVAVSAAKREALAFVQGEDMT